MATLRLSTPLRSYVGGNSELTLDGETVADTMRLLTEQYPALHTHLFNAQGELRPYIHLFVNNEDIRHLQGMDTPVKPEDRLMLVPSIAGG
jgi:molybdopterin converting factor small subunit